MRNERLPGSRAEEGAVGSGASGAGPGERRRPDRLRELLDALPVGVFTVDGAGNVLCLNEPAARLAGVDAASSLGRSCLDVFRCNVCGPVCLATQARRSGRSERALPVDVRGTDGVVRSVTAASCVLADGEVAITLQDVTLAERLRRDVEGRAPSASAPSADAPTTRAAARDLDTRAALHRAAGNVTIAARLLGIHRTTLWRRMCARGLERGRFHPGRSSP